MSHRRERRGGAAGHSPVRRDKVRGMRINRAGRRTFATGAHRDMAFQPGLAECLFHELDLGRGNALADIRFVTNSV